LSSRLTNPERSSPAQPTNGSRPGPPDGLAPWYIHRGQIGPARCRCGATGPGLRRRVGPTMPRHRHRQHAVTSWARPVARGPPTRHCPADDIPQRPFARRVARSGHHMSWHSVIYLKRRGHTHVACRR
jgi:hypothetical protein